MNLSDKALLVQLSISQWTARKYDRKATENVAIANGVATTVGRYNKSLLPATDTLAHVNAKATFIRSQFYKGTLPWGIEGTQILPTDNYLTFMADYRKNKREWDVLVTKFLLEYPSLVQDARLSLNGMFDEGDYPSQADIAKKFKMDIAVFPVPTTDFRVALHDDEMNIIKSDIEIRVNAAQKAAMNELWKRLFDKVKTMHDKLADPTSIFRDTLIENTREMCDTLTRLNITNDPDFEQMRSDVMTQLASYNPDTLRLDIDVRRSVAKRSADLMDKMRGFMEP